MIVDVAVPYRVSRTFHYLAEDSLKENLAPGSLVQVSFRNKPTHAFVVGLPDGTDIDPKRLKAIQSILFEEPLFDEPMLRFLRWVAEYYCCPIGEVLTAAIPKDAWNHKPAKKKKDESTPDGLAPSEPMGLLPHDIAVPELMPLQSQALEAILAGEDGKPTLLYGVTGSGKTEVYMRVLEKTLEEGRSAIVLAPEIALTPQLLGRFSSRFPTQTAVLHSDLTPKERHHQWQRIFKGEARVVIGARSAIFAPVKNLGLIVVDEEQEASFKQEDSLRYHARDVAVVRAKMMGARVILGSATPSLESYANAQSGKYQLVRLPERIMNRPMPKPIFVDLKNKDEFVSTDTPWLSRTMLRKLEASLANKQQALLYLNRLGYAHFLYCRDCGYTPQCKNCDVSLTFYQRPPVLKCHYCGAHTPPPNSCAKCAGVHFEPMGVGTEQLEKKLAELLPTARITRMDRSVVKTRKALEKLLKGIAAGDWDIVIGTQMITKGHDFPGIGLVGILLADASLSLPDFRAHERTFQVVTQVAGRAGRANIAGEVVIQTLNPDHFALRTAAENQPEKFYDQELAARQNCGYPPAVRLALLRFQHRNRDVVRTFAHQVTMEILQKTEPGKVQLLGPSEAPLSRVKNLYRWQCLMKARTVKEVQQAVALAYAFFEKQKTPVQMSADIDPIHLS